jgi:formylmethanofuran dehydrogenase subunit D
MILIAGRTSKQGTSLNVSKLEGEYVEITSTVEMNADDMARLGLEDGNKVRLKSPEGQTVASCKQVKAADLPSGVLFMAYGPSSSKLMGGDTAGTGMPISKNIEVELEVVR